jgi:pimeloyl-ACP methyl ester carboxylesterase
MRKAIPCIGLIVLFISCQGPASNKPVDIISNGVQIAYTSCGDADTTLLFVHGWCINKEYWDHQVKYFCPSYKVVAIDLPGFGLSGKNRSAWHFDEYTEDIKSVIEQLHLKNVILIGHSMSGDLVLHASNKYPALLAGIVGIDNLHEPAGPMSEQQQKETTAFFEMLSTSFDSTVSRYMTGSLFHPSTDSAVVNRVMNSVYTADSSIAISILRSLMEVSQQEKLRMQGLSHKLYLVNSDVFPIKTDSLSKYCSKGVHAELVPATGHYPMIEKPNDFNIALLKVVQAIGRKE